MSILTGQPSGRVVLVFASDWPSGTPINILVIPRDEILQISRQNAGFHYRLYEFDTDIVCGSDQLDEIYLSVIAEDVDIIWTRTRIGPGEHAWTRTPDLAEK